MPILDNMLVITPGPLTCTLVVRRHSTAMIGTIFQKILYNVVITSDKTSPESGQIGSLGQAMENDTIFERGIAEFPANL